jgi:HlyD family secretion protein
MKKKIIYIGLVILALATIVAVIKVNKSNSKPKKKYKTEQLKKMNIVNKVVATGKVTPLEEIEIKPQITGIIDKIMLLEGAKVKKGDLIATVRVVPNEQALISARGRVNNVRISLSNAEVSYKRNKNLFKKGVISRAEYEVVELTFNQAKQDLKNAQNDYQIIKKGSASSGGAANTNIMAQMSGTILEIPVKEGDQVIQSNNFNAGTTIASIADMSKMIFEGKVDEAEVGKLILGMDLDITIGAIEEEKFPAKLNFIAPKGIEESGAIQFKVKGDIKIDSIKQMVRAGYSANASIIIEKKDSIFAIREALLQYDKLTKKPFVEIEIGVNGEFEKKDIRLGVSDGINVEILAGVTKDDKIKVWNKENKKDKKED